MWIATTDNEEYHAEDRVELIDEICWDHVKYDKREVDEIELVVSGNEVGRYYFLDELDKKKFHDACTEALAEHWKSEEDGAIDEGGLLSDYHASVL